MTPEEKAELKQCAARIGEILKQERSNAKTFYDAELILRDCIVEDVNPEIAKNFF
jgi:hypothetical protein